MTPESSAPPTATYRLQLQPGFPFAAAEKAVPYLADLGVSHLHLSPVLGAVPGSTHGYDVVDHSVVRAELGGEEGLRALARTAAAHGLRLVVDLVPNHMARPAPASLNGPLWSVLRDGPASPYARWFDIDWDGGHGGRLLMPVLGGRLADELPMMRIEGDVLRYHEHAFPIRPGTERLPLPRLLDAQWYRLSWWRLARTELNYRRFFTISELIAVRVEDPEVFRATHATVLRLVEDGVIDGLRIDHPDGLADPAGYLARLARATGGRWTVVEKILTGGERLPRSWACAGTTGYDALRHIDGLFVCPEGADVLFGVYRDTVAPLADRGGDWEETVRQAACEVVTHELAAEIDRLVRTATRISERTPHHGDHAPWALRRALHELLVRLPVYRPYAQDPWCAERDAAMLEAAAEGAAGAFEVREEARSVELVRDLALGRLADGAEDDDGADHADFAARFAQTASALHAKSVEDRAFYRYTPLLSACEVGGDPGCPAVTVDAFHAFCGHLQENWPTSGTVLSTHDTKRSADVRARIAALSECPEGWREVLARLNTRTALTLDSPEPDPQMAWTAWQTAFGMAHPGPGAGTATAPEAGAATAPGAGAYAASCQQDGAAPYRQDGPASYGHDGASFERLEPAILKAVREAALHTTWTEQDATYEESVTDFLEAGPCSPTAAAELAAFADELSPFVRANVLGAALLHLTMPGVPDLYQGTEREFTALVDPDNRAPARYSPEFLADVDGGTDGGAPAGDPQGFPDLSAEKLRLTAAALRLRRAHPDWFGPEGTYRPLHADGDPYRHCVAFARADRAVTVATRLSLRLAESGGWHSAALRLPDAPSGVWHDLLTGRDFEGASVPLSALLDRLPVALLVLSAP
ncbi:malto-oligosyltrehalose synthase [Streptomyces sp. NPDC053560]|uniref:malto-oligosyltrehalose synthase n=1 Tax=Streptomyces sp. NPDC053560 TaxID=3365711 RepID=UPI0037D29F0E